MSTNNRLRLGPHEAWLEPPDIFVTHWRGEVRPEHMTAMFDEVEKIASTIPVLFALNIVRDVKALNSETRKAASHDSRGKHMCAMAIVGASFHIRVISTMLLKASALIGTAAKMPVAFFNTEDEGRNWLAIKRIELAPAPMQTH